MTEGGPSCNPSDSKLAPDRKKQSCAIETNYIGKLYACFQVGKKFQKANRQTESVSLTLFMNDYQ